MMLRTFLMTSTIMALAACATVETESLPSDQGAAGLTYSLPIQYVKLTLKREITNVTTTDGVMARYNVLKAEQAAAKTNLDAAAAARKSAEEVLAYARALGISGTELNALIALEAKAKHTTDLAKVVYDTIAKSDKLKNHKEALENAMSDDPKPETWGIKSTKDTLVVMLEKPTADPRIKYSAFFTHNWFRSDKHGLEVNEHGLLQSANLESTGETMAVLTAVASTIAVLGAGLPVGGIDNQSGAKARDLGNGGEFLQAQNALNNNDAANTSPPALPRSLTPEQMKKIMATLGAIDIRLEAIINRLVPKNIAYDCATQTSLQYWDEKTRKQIGAITHEEILDPTDGESVIAFNRRACELGSNFRFAIDNALPKNLKSMSTSNVMETQLLRLPLLTNRSYTPKSTLKHCKKHAKITGRGVCAGLVYKRLQPLRLSIVEHKKTVSGSIVQMSNETETVHIPNASPPDVMPVSGSLFATNTAGLVFKDGTLIKYDFERPAEAKVIADGAFAIVKAPFQAVAEVIKINVGAAEGQKAIADAAYGIEKLRVEQELSLAKQRLQSNIDLEGMSATRSSNLALALLENDNELALTSSQNDTALRAEILKRAQNQSSLDQELLTQEIKSLTRGDTISEAEMDRAIERLKKQKEALQLMRDIEELSKVE